MINKTVYISGPITGTNDYITRFAAAEETLREWGYTKIINPASAERIKEMPEAETTWEEYMQADLKDLIDADAIYLLSGWQNSRGANIEYFVAHVLKKEILLDNGIARDVEQAIRSMPKMYLPYIAGVLPGDVLWNEIRHRCSMSKAMGWEIGKNG